MANIRNIDLVSFVGVFDAQKAPQLQVGAQTVRDVENKLGQTVQGAEGVSERGPAQFILVPRDQIELLIEKERIEVRRRYPGELIKDGPMMANTFWSALNSMSADPSKFPWIRFGYNMILSTPAVPTAIEKLAVGLFSDTFKKALGYPITGAAAWTWLKVDSDVTLWLRLEPFRNDPTANRVAVTANFLVENGNMPPQNEFSTNLDGYSTKLNEILDRIGL
ncbi:MAG: hypothetical protein O3A93_04830 [Chloroflexi bacterium]|nr:hypothetical protein [Chloroflexota bacterium]MDA1270568.1 hypothetical protein [Chloroflexota bacterium]PKB59734.1 MAG: hypothetical protein BZY83_00215 [SAR202 cluster bacterium Casp-Chloro-G2]